MIFLKANGEVMRNTLRVALQNGYRAIDTAPLYKNEEDVGQELNEWLQQGKLKREEIFVTSKVLNYICKLKSPNVI